MLVILGQVERQREEVDMAVAGDFFCAEGALLREVEKGSRYFDLSRVHLRADLWLC